MRRNVEIEWQFDVGDVVELERWLVRARFDDGWSLARPSTVHLSDAYFDTADWRLWRAGYALRVRRAGAKVEATLKAFGRARGGAARRREITQRLRDARIATLRGSAGVVGTRLRRMAGGHPPRRLFAVRTRRRVLALRRNGRVVGEIALDRTRIAARGAERRLERLEIEVKRGAPAVVERFVALLRRRRDLAVARRSKFESGLAAAGLRPRRRR